MLGVNDAVNVSLSLYCGVSPVTARLVVPVPWLTVCVSAADVLLVKLLLPVYVAVIERVPALTAEVVSEAVPLLSVAVPSSVDPSKNCTLPVGVPLPLVTVAVNVTDWPYVDGFKDDVGVDVVVGVWVLTLTLISTLRVALV